MKFICFSVSGSTRVPYNYITKYYYEYYGDLDPLQALNNAMDEFLATENALEAIHCDSNYKAVLEYEYAFGRVPKGILEKHGFIEPPKREVDKLIVLDSWDSRPLTYKEKE